MRSVNIATGLRLPKNPRSTEVASDWGGSGVFGQLVSIASAPRSRNFLEGDFWLLLRFQYRW